MAGIVAKHRKQMKFCNSHLIRNIFNLYVRRFFFGLVYKSGIIDQGGSLYTLCSYDTRTHQ